jgi:hypothetical protein
MRATCPAHLNFLDLITLTKKWENSKQLKDTQLKVQANMSALWDVITLWNDP